jgi:Tol biopolymer transport system component
VVAGDGTGDHLLAAGVAHVAPAWRPGGALGPFELAYVTARGRVVVRDGDTGRALWSTGPAPRPFELMWSADGGRLLVLSSRQARTYSAAGGLISRVALPGAVSDGALSPDGRKLALVLGGREVAVGSGSSLRQVLAGPGVKAVSWSPDGRWLLVTWPAANQWVFVRVAGTPRIEAVSRIAQQFSSGGAAHAFPELDGWCCTVRGAAG